MIWIVRGTHRSTNTPREFRIEAPSERDARSMASAAGLIISTVTPLDAQDHAHAAPPTNASSPAAGAPAPPRPHRPPPAPARSVPTPPLAPRRPVSNYSLLRDPVILIIALAANVIYFVTTGQLSAFTGAGDTPDVSAHIGLFVAFLLGFYVIGLLVAWVVSRLTGRRPMLARIAFTVCTILLVALSIGAYRLRQPEIAQTALATTRPAQAQQLSPLKNTAAPEPSPRPTSATAPAPATNPSATPTTRLSPADLQYLPKLKEVALAVRKELADDTHAYQAEVSRVTGAGLLSAENFGSAERINKTRQVLRYLRAIIDAHEKKDIEIFDSYPKRINALSIPDNLKRASIEGFQQQSAKSRQVITDLAKADRDFCDQAGKLADFMESHLGEFRISGTQIIFNADAHADEYNRRVASIEQIVAKEEQLTQQAQKDAAAAMERMDNLLK